MTPLDVLARAQGAMGALQATMADLVGLVAEAEQRADTAERRVRELERQAENGWRDEYRRGYSAGHMAGRAGRPSTPRMDRQRPMATA